MQNETLVEMARAAMADERLSDGALYGKLADRIEALEAALRPFARVVPLWGYVINPGTPDHGVCSAISFTAGDYRRAYAALKEPSHG